MLGMAMGFQETVRARRALLAAAIVLCLAAVALWHYPPIAERVSLERLARWVGSFESAAWAPAAIVAAYVLAGLLMFPLTVMIGATAIVFEPPTALAISLTGSLANALVLYHLGARLGRRTMHAALGNALDRVSAVLARRGIMAVALVRSIPVAPFTVVNLAAGSLGVAQRDYLLGTALGLAPGIVMITAFGNRLRALLQEPTPGRVGALLAILFAWFAIVWVLQRLASRRHATSSS
jgi:phospholipase D1/2